MSRASLQYSTQPACVDLVVTDGESDDFDNDLVIIASPRQGNLAPYSATANDFASKRNRSPSLEIISETPTETLLLPNEASEIARQIDQAVKDAEMAKSLQDAFNEEAREEALRERKRLRAEAAEQMARKLQKEYELRARELVQQEIKDTAIAKRMAEEEEARVEAERQQAIQRRDSVALQIAEGTYEHTGGHTDSRIVALLVTLFKAAAYGACTYREQPHRAERIMTPYPNIPNSSPPLNPSQREYTNLYHAAYRLPEYKSLADTPDFNSLRDQLTLVHPTTFPLLRWVVNTNCTYLEHVPRTLQIDALGTPYQYIMLIGSPEKEEAFQALKAQHGVKWAFHGSATANWHSILRNGLINLSGTANQLHGVAYGNGVYLAPDASLSLKDYSKGAETAAATDPALTAPINWQKMVCLTLCEVIANSYQEHNQGWCWTVQDAKAIMTRMLFVFPEGKYKFNTTKCTTLDPQFVTTAEATLKGMADGI